MRVTTHTHCNSEPLLCTLGRRVIFFFIACFLDSCLNSSSAVMIGSVNFRNIVYLLSISLLQWYLLLVSRLFFSCFLLESLSPFTYSLVLACKRTQTDPNGNIAINNATPSYNFYAFLENLTNKSSISQKKV